MIVVEPKENFRLKDGRGPVNDYMRAKMDVWDCMVADIHKSSVGGDSWRGVQRPASYRRVSGSFPRGALIVRLNPRLPWGYWP